MSNHAREGINANSALIVTVTPEDFPEMTAMGGITFQRRLEEAAYRAGAGRIPVQMYGDFKAGRNKPAVWGRGTGFLREDGLCRLKPGASGSSLSLTERGN